MKKLILAFILLLIPSICWAVHLYEPYINYPNNPNLTLITDTYEGNGSNIHIGCFLYSNTEGAKIGGEVFQYEYLCLIYNNMTNGFSTFKESKSRFIYYNNRFTYGDPYYFDRSIVQQDVKDMFIDLLEGTWSDRD